MFTGIIVEVGEVRELRRGSESARLALAAFVSALCACMAVAALVLQRVIGGGKALA